MKQRTIINVNVFIDCEPPSQNQVGLILSNIDPYSGDYLTQVMEALGGERLKVIGVGMSSVELQDNEGPFPEQDNRRLRVVDN